MKKERWELWLESKKILKKDFESFFRKKIIRKSATETEIGGHLKKAKRNLLFARKIIDEFFDFYEWAIIVCYYAMYQAALALCAAKGFKTKSHFATIAIMVRFYYPKYISKEEIALIKGIEEKEIREFAEAKSYREDASYSISIRYEKSLAENLGSTAIGFVNKAERIIRKE